MMPGTAGTSPAQRDPRAPSSRDARPPPSARLADDLAGRLVGAQSLEARVPEHPLPRPFLEADLGDQLRLRPVHPPLAHLVATEGRSRLLQLLQLPPEGPQGALVEAGADLAGVHEGAVLVVAQQQRAERGPAALRIGPAADDEF